jgi:hypothetical protein
MTHEGHLQKDEKEIQVLLNHHDDENKRLALSAMQVHLGGGFATQALVSNHHQAFLMPSQLQNLKRIGIRTGPCPQPALIDPTRSAAERLIDYFQNQPDLSFTALYAKIEIAESLLTIKKKSNKSNKKQKKMTFKGLEMSTVYTNGGVTTTSLNASDLVAPGETNTPQSHTDRILGALTVTSEDGEKRLLLGVAWVSAEQRRLANCFPEAWGIDVAFGTNSEQRPLVSGTTKLSTNQRMTHFHAFLPCLARWAYKWTFGTAMPLLLGKQALERNNAFCTDAEE